MRWTVAEVADALGVSAPTGADSMARLAGVSIDSRTVKPGELFVAIHGPRHDGHHFVAAALAQGCRRYLARPAGIGATLLRRVARGGARAPGGCRYRIRGQNDHQGNSCGIIGRAVPRFEIRGKSE